MSCKCPSAVQIGSVNGLNRNIVATDNDFEASNQNAQVHVVGNESGNPSVTVSLPPNPLHGQSIRLVAAGAPITVDGNENTLAAGASYIPQGKNAVYVFTQVDECSCEGVWTPDCCPEAPPVQ